MKKIKLFGRYGRSMESNLEQEVEQVHTRPSWLPFKLHSKRLFGATTISLVLLAFFSTVALASIPASDGTISGCYDSYKGNLRVIDTAVGAACNSTEKALNWNQKGPKGDTGAVGAQGPQGPQGPAGPGVNTNLICPQCNKTGAYLAGANLSGAYLPVATLNGANLGGTNLAAAYMTAAYLKNAYMAYTALFYANLQTADLTGAYLYGAQLGGSNLTDTVLDNANMSNAVMKYARGIPKFNVNTIWSNTICPDGTNSDYNSGTCAAHWVYF
jgi:hypothetical protein